MTAAPLLTTREIRWKTRRMSIHRIAAAAIILGMMPAGSPAGVADNHLPSLPTIEAKLGKTKFTLWIAATNAQQDRGLMYIRRLPANTGMLFYFRRPVIARFWMRHTLIPLDILYIRKSGKIVNCFTMPVDNGKKTYISSRPITIAIELAAGAIHRLGLHTGQVLHLPERKLLRQVKIADGEAVQP